MTRTRLPTAVYLGLAYMLLWFVPACTIGAAGSWWMREDTRAIEIHAEGEVRGETITTRHLLLPGVPVPAPRGEREVQETQGGASDKEDVRADDEASETGARVDARRADADARAELVFPTCWKPSLIAFAAPGTPMRVMSCQHLDETRMACASCTIGAYALAVKTALSTLPRIKRVRDVPLDK